MVENALSSYINLDFQFLRLFLFCVALGLLFRLNLSIIHKQVWTRTKSQQLIFATLPAVGFVITSVISGNIALSLGMVGALSIVRFRSPIKNPYELVSYFYLITVGIATSVNPTISINFFIATILISLLIESGNFIGERFGLNSSINELDEFTKTNFLLLKTKKKIDEYADSRFLRNFSFSESEYTYNFSDNDITNLEKILDQINESEIISYYFEKN
tara:strand:- start:1468 stop:2118 length:651 start_codon:yes stop_codon:yes gene_type:complete